MMTTRTWEARRLMVSSCLLVVAGSDSACTDPVALWSGEELAEDDWKAARSSCLLPLSFSASNWCSPDVILCG